MPVAFKPFDDATVSLSANTSSSRVAFNASHNGSTCRVVNRGSDWLFIKFGNSAVVADVNDIPVPPNWVDAFSVPDGATHCAGLSEGTSTLYVTPGDGE